MDNEPVHFKNAMLSDHHSTHRVRPVHVSTNGALIANLLLVTRATAQSIGAAASVRVSGSVKDPTGAITGAQVSIAIDHFHEIPSTNAERKFVLEHIPAVTGTLTIQPASFDTLSRNWNATSSALNLEIQVQPSSVLQQITVPAARTEVAVAESAATITVLTPERLSTMGPVMVDDVLRQVTAFNFFRHSSSRTANPTTQGVFLRGLTSSGASRGLVISGSVPLNDPFGSWVYWDRIPREGIRSVEVVNGGACALYWTDALNGVINIIRKPASGLLLPVESSYCTENTPDALLFASHRVRYWAGSLRLDLSHTHGDIPVAVENRGLAGTFARAQFVAGNAAIERLLTNQGRIFVRGSLFGERRKNGTLLQVNSTTIREVDIGGDWRSNRLGLFSLVGYAGRQIFDHTFSAISLDHNKEPLTTAQTMVGQQVGFHGQRSRTGQYAPRVCSRCTGISRSAEPTITLSWLRGILPVLPPQAVASARGGAFEDVVRLSSRRIFTPVVRIDHWRNLAALTSLQPFARPGVLMVTPEPERSETFFSPPLGTVYDLTHSFSPTAAGHRSFRAPSLNELYRSFRVGNVFTQGDGNLLAERLTGGAAGAIYSGLGQRFTIRGNFFWSAVTHPIENVTLQTTPTLISRQRQNLDRTRSQGGELEAQGRLTNRPPLFPAEPALVELQMPQVPRYQFTAQALYSAPSFVTIGVEGRHAGVQFDDDLKTLPLDRLFALDTSISHAVSPRLDVFVAAENLTKQRYEIARTPVQTLGPPLLARRDMSSSRLRLGGQEP